MNEVPAHEGWWTRKRRVQLEIANGVLTGAGAGLWLFGEWLAAMPVVWLSRMTGDYDDDVWLIGIEHAILEGQERHHEGGVLQRFCSNAVSEFVLDEHTIGLVEAEREGSSDLDDRCWSVVNDQLGKARIALYIHDDCFFSIR